MPVGAARAVLESGKGFRIKVIAEGAQGQDGGGLGTLVQGEWLLKRGTVLTCYCGLQTGWGGPGNLTAVRNLSPALVYRSGTYTNVGSTTSATIAKPTGLAAGDIAFAVVRGVSLGVDERWIMPAGWRRLRSARREQDPQNAQSWTMIYAKKVTAADVAAANLGVVAKTNTGSHGSGNFSMSVTCFAYYNNSGTDIDIDLIGASFNSGSGTSLTSAAVTPSKTAAGRIITFWKSIGGSTTALTTPTGHTARATQTPSGGTGGLPATFDGNILISDEAWTGSSGASTARVSTSSINTGWFAYTIFVYERSVGGGASSVWWDGVNQITAGGGGGNGFAGSFGTEGDVGEAGQADGVDYGGDGGNGGAGGSTGGAGGLGGGGYARGSQSGTSGGTGGGGGGGGGGNASSDAQDTVLGGAGGTGGTGNATGSTGGNGSNGLLTNAPGGSVGSGGTGGAGGLNAETGETGETPAIGPDTSATYYTYTAAGRGGDGGYGGRAGYGANGNPGSNYLGTAANTSTTADSRSGDGRIRIYKNNVLVATFTAAGETTQTYTV